jgi:DNA polymerase-3 subunit epsilon
MIEIVLDTETTGLSYQEDKIIEIACIEIKDQIPTGKKFHTFLNPQIRISAGAYETHGISESFLQDKPRFKNIAKDFLNFIQQHPLVIHNADFDLSFLNKELKDSGLEPILKTRVKDTLAIARDKFPGLQNSIDALCKRFKIDNSRRQKHSALLDCDLLTKIYIELLDKKEPTLNLSFTQTKALEQEKEHRSKRKPIFIEVSDEEYEAHKAFLKSKLPKSFLLN